MSTINYTYQVIDYAKIIWGIKTDAGGNVWVVTGDGSGYPNSIYANIFENGNLKWRSNINGTHYSDVKSLEVLANGYMLFGMGANTGDASILRALNPYSTSIPWSLGDGNFATVFNLSDCRDIRAVRQLSSGTILLGAGFQTGQARCYRSTDNGSNWSRVTYPNESNVELIDAIEDCTGGIVLMGVGYTPAGSGEIYRSTDDGQTFTEIHLDNDVDIIMCIKYCENGIVLASAGWSSGDSYVYKSSNYGAPGSWSRVQLDPSIEYINALEYAGRGVCYAGTGGDPGDGNIWKSYDFGSTWTKVSTVNVGSVTVIQKLSSGNFLFGTADPDTSHMPSYYSGKLWTGATTASPTITTISPNSNISYGNTITITGTDLKEYTSTVLKIDGVDYSANITANTTTSLTFTAPNLSSGNHSVTVTVLGTTSAPSTITYQAAAITSISPNTDIIYGSDITITGVNLQGLSSTVLKIDGTTYSTTSISRTTVHFNAPNLYPGTRSVKLVVDGTDTNTVNIVYPSPSITSITPNTDIINNETLTMAGKGLLGVAYNNLFIDGVDYTAKIVSKTSLQIVFAAPNLYPGSRSVTVQVDGGAVSNSYGITYLSPSITSITPSTNVKGGDTLTLIGNGLIGVAYTALLINGVDYTVKITSATETQIIFTAPDLPNGTFPVKVKVGDGYFSNESNITYLNPVITTIDPTTDVQTGALMTIVGSGLQGTTSTGITINSTDYSLAITSVSSTKITFIAPKLAVGSYPVRIVLDGTFTSAPFTITYSTRSITTVAIRSPLLYQHFENDDGTPLEFGKVYTYYAGTTNPLATIDFNGVENPNPIYLDAGGNADIYLKPGYSYKFLVKDANDVLIPNGVQDNISYAGTSGGGVTGTSVTVETIADLKNLVAGAYTYATVLGYYAKTDGIGPRQYYWDSASTLADDGGSVVKITASATGRWKLVAGKEIDAKWFGATGNGTTNDQPSLYNASLYLTAIGGGKLILSYGAYNITSALTLGANVELVPLPGAYFKSTNGSNLTINNMALTGNSKRFDSTLGTISFGNMVDYVLPEWFGAVSDGTTDDSSAIQKALNSCAKVVFSAKTYKVNAGLTANVSQEIIGGDAILSPNANSITVLSVPQCSTAADAVKISRLNISNAGTRTGVTGLSSSRSSCLTLSDIFIKDVETGISLSAGQNQNVTNLTVKGCSSVGLKLIGPAIEDFVGNDFSSVTLDGNQVGLMAYTGAGGSSALKNITFNGINLVNNTVAGGYFKDVVVSMTGLQLYSNGSGAASVTIDSKTIYKSDLYLDAATVSINASEVDTSLNNSIQLINSACLNTNNFTGYSSESNTQILCDATSRVVESGYVDAIGYRNNIQKYGELKSISHPFICDGAGLSVITMSMENHGNKYTQYVAVNTTTGATSTYDKTGKGLTKKVTFNTVVGSQSANSVSPYLSNDFSKTYQITTLLIRAVSGAPLMTIEWNDNSTSWSHNIALQSNGSDWTRLVFITKNKTTHKLYIYPADTSGPAIYLSELMEYDTNNLDAISAIYSNGLVAYSKIGSYYGTSPAAGTWEVGDVVYDIAPASSGYIGWTCTVAGTPGTWKTFGLIS